MPIQDSAFPAPCLAPVSPSPACLGSTKQELDLVTLPTTHQPELLERPSALKVSLRTAALCSPSTGQAWARTGSSAGLITDQSNMQTQAIPRDPAKQEKTV